jgi:hypothetical protein
VHTTPVLAQGAAVPERLLMLGPVPVVNARLDSLEQVVRGTTNRATLFSAVMRITASGLVWAYAGEAAPIVVYPGIVVRLRRVYPSVDPYSRGAIVQGLSAQAEQNEALAWLRELAASSDMADEFSIAEVAVEALARMGPMGEAELRRMHGLKAEYPEIQKMLDVLARTGYRRQPGGR